MQKKKKKRDEESADEPGITKLEYRRRLLKQRIREWDDFLKTKPDLVGSPALRNYLYHVFCVNIMLLFSRNNLCTFY